MSSISCATISTSPKLNTNFTDSKEVPSLQKLTMAVIAQKIGGVYKKMYLDILPDELLKGIAEIMVAKRFEKIHNLMRHIPERMQKMCVEIIVAMRPEEVKTLVCKVPKKSQRLFFAYCRSDFINELHGELIKFKVRKNFFRFKSQFYGEKLREIKGKLVSILAKYKIEKGDFFEKNDPLILFQKLFEVKNLENNEGIENLKEQYTLWKTKKNYISTHFFSSDPYLYSGLRIGKGEEG